MLVTSHLPINHQSFLQNFDYRLFSPHFEKDSATHVLTPSSLRLLLTNGVELKKLLRTVKDLWNRFQNVLNS